MNYKKFLLALFTILFFSTCSPSSSKRDSFTKYQMIDGCEYLIFASSISNSKGYGGMVKVDCNCVPNR